MHTAGGCEVLRVHKSNQINHEHDEPRILEVGCGLICVYVFGKRNFMEIITITGCDGRLIVEDNTFIIIGKKDTTLFRR